MNFWEICLLGVVLATDACALTIANCTVYKKSLSNRQELAMPIAFAFFQFAMAILGYFIGNLVYNLIAPAQEYIKAGIFLALTIKIVVDNLKELKERTMTFKEAQKESVKARTFSIKILLVQAVATSIDSLAVGLTLGALTITYALLGTAIIGGVTFLLVLFALFIGKRLGKVFENYAQWLGAVILFALSINSLLMAIL